MAVAFWIFDKNSVGWISYLDLKEGLHDLGIHATEVACKLIINQYDVDWNAKLTFEEFNNIFMPTKSEYQKLLVKEPPEFIDELPPGKYFWIDLRDYFNDPTIIQYKTTL